MRTIRIKLYKFGELSNMAQEAALIAQINFEMDVMDVDSIFYPAVLRMEAMQTPWFLAETLFFDYKQQLIDTIEANDYEFTKDGKLA